MAPSATIEPYWKRFSRLKDEKGLSWSQLVRASTKASLSTLRSLAVEPATDSDGIRGRERYPSADTLADVANALKVDPNEFPEYRLAMFRAAFDEREIGDLETPMWRLLEVEEFIDELQSLNSKIEIKDRTDNALLGSLRLKTLIWGVESADLVVTINGELASDSAHDAIRTLFVECKSVTPKSGEQLVQSGLAAAQRTADRALALFGGARPPGAEGPPPSNELESRRRSRKRAAPRRDA